MAGEIKYTPTPMTDTQVVAAIKADTPLATEYSSGSGQATSATPRAALAQGGQANG